MLKIKVETLDDGGANFKSETQNTTTFEAFNALIGIFELILKFDKNYKNYRQIYKHILKLKKELDIEEEDNNG